MFVGELICSDEACELVLEAVGTLEDLELLVCDDCGCCLQIVFVSAHEATALAPRIELSLAA